MKHFTASFYGADLLTIFYNIIAFYSLCKIPNDRLKDLWTITKCLYFIFICEYSIIRVCPLLGSTPHLSCSLSLSLFLTFCGMDFLVRPVLLLRFLPLSSFQVLGQMPKSTNRGRTKGSNQSAEKLRRKKNLYKTNAGKKGKKKQPNIHLIFLSWLKPDMTIKVKRNYFFFLSQ